MKKNIDYNFSNLNRDVVQRLLADRGVMDDFLMLPFIGNGRSIKTAYFQSKTSERAFVAVGNSYYMTKKMPWYCSDSKYLTFLYDHYNKLHDQGYPCPAVLKTMAGKSLSQIDGDYYACFVYVDGYEYAHTPKQAYAVGAQLAELHNTTFGMANVAYHETIADSFNQLAEIANIPEITAIKQFVANTFHQLKGYTRYSCIVHGDCNPSNFIFGADGSVKAVVDFDNTKADNPIRDIAEAVLTFGVVSYQGNTSNFKDIWNEPDQTVCLELLHGYKAHTEHPEIFADLVRMLPLAIKIISAELYVLSFLKKNQLQQPEFLASHLDLGFLKRAI